MTITEDPIIKLADGYINPETRPIYKEKIQEIEKSESGKLFIQQVIKSIFNVLYQKAFPTLPPVPAEKIEVATFGRSTDFTGFSKVGLLLEVISIHSTGKGKGHTGKTLINLPGQFLPEHRHTDVLILRKGASIPHGYSRITELIDKFIGIHEYTVDGVRSKKLKYSIDDFEIAVAESETSSLPADYPKDYVIEFIEGKSETFKFVYGSGILFVNKEEIVIVRVPEGSNPFDIPSELKNCTELLRKEEVISTEDLLYATPGLIVLLKKNTKHAFLAADSGCVYLEFSSPSLDEADVFTDRRIKRC